MKKIKFNKLHIENFRNITNIDIDFNEDVTKILGANGLGKTNTLSAIMWCLFGKDIYDVKQFPISPIINGVEDNDFVTIVRMTINDNYVVERKYTKRKIELKTGWIIDGKENLVLLSQAKYNQELAENLVDEETFKSLSNINYIPSMHWKDFKKLIFGLIGGITDEEVLLRDDFNLIEEYVKKFGIEQTQKLIKETEKELNEDIKRLETEYQTLTNTKEKYVSNDEENKQLEIRKKEIEEEIFNSQKIQENNIKIEQEYNELSNEKLTISNKIIRNKNEIDFVKNMINDFEKLYKQFSFNEENERAKETEKVMADIRHLESEINEENETIIKLKSNLEEIKIMGNNLKQKEIKIENNLCSTCGQKLPEETIKSTLDKLKKQQLNELNDLKSQFDMQKAMIKNHENELAE